MTGSFCLIALSANHIVVTSQDYRKLGDWYGDLLELRETSDGGRDVYQWFGDSVWIPTAVAEGAQTSFELDRSTMSPTRSQTTIRRPSKQS